MKILRLRFTNLNSLRGDSPVIDFTQPPFAGAGLFAIVGQTGAGKTTILDAITLALYGRAARYGEDRPEQMMSRHTGECSAEVEFECASGIYRSVWQLRRSRRKADGEMQQPTRRIIDMESEMVLAEKLRDADLKIVELTGLDYQRFLRSVMLAQGEFAAFLKAEAKERTQLLEQVTNTGIYGEISKAAFERAKQALQALKELQLRQGEVKLLTEEERLAKQVEITALEQQLASVNAALKALEARLQVVRDAQRWTAEEKELAAAAELLATDQTEFSVMADRLARHRQALPWQGALAEWRSAKHAVQQRERDQNLLQARLPALQEAASEAERIANVVQESVLKIEAEEQTLRPLLREVHALDAELKGATQRTEEAGKTYAAAAARLASLETELASGQKELENFRTQVAVVESWLQKHEGDAALPPVLTQLSGQLSLWAEKQQQLDRLAAEMLAGQELVIKAQAKVTSLAESATALEKAHQKSITQQTKAQQALDTITEGRKISEWETLRDEVERKLRQLQELQRLHSERQKLEQVHAEHAEALKKARASWREIKAAVEVQVQQEQQAQALVEARRETLTFAERVQSLEGHRANLKPNEACPLCGAMDHPFADSAEAPTAEMAKFKQALKLAEVELTKIQKTLQAGREAAARTETQGTSSAAAVKKAEEQLAANAQQWDALETGIPLAEAEGVAVKVASQSDLAAGLVKRLKSLREAEQSLANAIQVVAKTEREWQETRLAQATAVTQSEHARNVIVDLTAKQDAEAKALAEVVRQVRELLDKSGEAAESLAEATQASKRLEKRVQNLETKKQDARNLVASRDNLLAVLEVKQAQRAALLPELETLHAAAVQARQAHALLAGQREHKFGKRVVTVVEQDFNQRLQSIRADKEKTAANLQQAQSALAAGRQQCQDGEVALLKLREQFNAQELELTVKVSEAGFLGIDGLQAAMLDAATVQAAEAQHQALQNRAVAVSTRRQKLEQDRASLSVEALADLARAEELGIELVNQRGLQATAQGQHAVAQEQLRRDADDRQRFTGLTAEIQAAERDRERWGRLSDRIGSASGLSFAKFAQGLTLDRLVSLANHHLTQLNPRYSLQRDEKRLDELELEIVDHYQADTTRAMQSLSGGESFLASLALALGLSELAGGKSRIDSLFIDEGFGTLDAETIEVAMSALENLQSTGKTIGVISHVEAMKERIATQIRVVKIDGGCSRLEF